MGHSMASSFDSSKELRSLPPEKNSSGVWNRCVRKLSSFHWFWETLSLLLSCVCIIAILTILAKYNGRPLPSWGYGITINGVISILAVVAKASMILPIAESISQLKWYCFWNRSRPMLDFQLLDTASRGPWGCLVMLTKPRLWNIAALGAALTLASVVMEPCLQLIPSYPTRDTLIANSSIPRATSFSNIAWQPILSAPVGGNNRPSVDIGLDSKGAFLSGILNFDSDTSGQVSPTCTTGNCTWPSFSTLAVCSTCDNITSLITAQVEGPSVAYWDLPNGAKADRWAENLVSTSSKIGSLVYPETANLSLLDLTYMYLPSLADGLLANKPYAFECLLYFCVQTISSRMYNGTLSETIVSAWPDGNTSLPDQPSLSLETVYSFDVSRDLPNVTAWVLTPPDSKDNYKIDMTTLITFKQWVSAVMSGVISSTGEDSWVYNSVAVQGWYYGQIKTTSGSADSMNRTVRLDSPAVVAERVAKSLTTHIRTLANSSTAVLGATHSAHTQVDARWYWALPPVALVLMTACLMVLTITLSKKREMPTWKSSILAALLHGPDDVLVRDGRGLGLHEMERHCEGIVVGVNSEMNDMRLVTKPA